jgi:hypothetical protein
MDESDPMTATADAGCLVDETGAGGPQMLQRRIDVGHLEGEMVKTLTVPVEEAPNR